VLSLRVQSPDDLTVLSGDMAGRDHWVVSRACDVIPAYQSLLLINWVRLNFPRFNGHPERGYQLKTPYRDGTMHVVFELLDFMARLAALVPRPQVNLTRYQRVFVALTRLSVYMAKRQYRSRK